eukprot:scaffold6815_cov213-Alexandrium_tamarense.AAC.1
MSSVQPEQPDAEERGGERKEVFPLATQIVSMSLGFIAFIMSAVAAGGCDFARAKNSGFWYTSEYNIGLFQG